MAEPINPDSNESVIEEEETSLEPLGIKNPLLAAASLGQSFLQPQFLSPLGATPLVSLDSSEEFSQEISNYKTLANFFPEYPVAGKSSALPSLNARVAPLSATAPIPAPVVQPQRQKQKSYPTPSQHQSSTPVTPPASTILEGATAVVQTKQEPLSQPPIDLSPDISDDPPQPLFLSGEQEEGYLGESELVSEAIAPTPTPEASPTIQPSLEQSASPISLNNSVIESSGEEAIAPTPTPAASPIIQPSLEQSASPISLNNSAIEPSGEEAIAPTSTANTSPIIQPSLEQSASPASLNNSAIELSGEEAIAPTPIPEASPTIQPSLEQSASPASFNNSAIEPFGEMAIASSPTIQPKLETPAASSVAETTNETVGKNVVQRLSIESPAANNVSAEVESLPANAEFQPQLDSSLPADSQDSPVVSNTEQTLSNSSEFPTALPVPQPDLLTPELGSKSLQHTREETTLTTESADISLQAKQESSEERFQNLLNTATPEASLKEKSSDDATVTSFPPERETANPTQDTGSLFSQAETAVQLSSMDNSTQVETPSVPQDLTQQIPLSSERESLLQRREALPAEESETLQPQKDISPVVTNSDTSSASSQTDTPPTVVQRPLEPEATDQLDIEAKDSRELSPRTKDENLSLFNPQHLELKTSHTETSALPLDSVQAKAESRQSQKSGEAQNIEQFLSTRDIQPSSTEKSPQPIEENSLLQAKAESRQSQKSREAQNIEQSRFTGVIQPSSVEKSPQPIEENSLLQAKAESWQSQEPGEATNQDTAQSLPSPKTPANSTVIQPSENPTQRIEDGLSEEIETTNLASAKTSEATVTISESASEPSIVVQTKFTTPDVFNSSEKSSQLTSEVSPTTPAPVFDSVQREPQVGESPVSEDSSVKAKAATTLSEETSDTTLIQPQHLALGEGTAILQQSQQPTVTSSELPASGFEEASLDVSSGTISPTTPQATNPVLSQAVSHEVSQSDRENFNSSAIAPDEIATADGNVGSASEVVQRRIDTSLPEPPRNTPSTTTPDSLPTASRPSTVLQSQQEGASANPDIVVSPAVKELSPASPSLAAEELPIKLTDATTEENRVQPQLAAEQQTIPAAIQNSVDSSSVTNTSVSASQTSDRDSLKTDSDVTVAQLFSTTNAPPTLPRVLENLTANQALGHSNSLGQPSVQATPSASFLIQRTLKNATKSVVPSTTAQLGNSQTSSTASNPSPINPEATAKTRQNPPSPSQTPASWSSIAELLGSAPNPEPAKIQRQVKKPSTTESQSSVIQRLVEDEVVFTPEGFRTADSRDRTPTTKELSQPKTHNPNEISVTDDTESNHPGVTISSSMRSPAANSSSLETLAQEIYSLLRQRLELERERHGRHSSGRLPW